eukprot:TRINITY_DN34312_c0_g1_i1.p1 TRINITY_DN34312_c0_g1~~TRINITY_DN34312_c0_g1_i1.p1  ORF type:complete len:695 (+),score=119.76 TRINITY_DN34312_c0_g1_i1:75-2087(+)
MAAAAPAPDAAVALARQLRECAARRTDCPAELVSRKINEWRVTPGLEPSKYVNIGNGNGKSALHFAAQLHDAAVVQLLLDIRANVNISTARGHTPLIYASGRARDGNVSVLLNAGARCKVRTANGDTALSVGSSRLSSDSVSALRQAEAEEEEDWLDFSLIDSAIEAQADHIEQMKRVPKQAQKKICMSPAVAELMAKRQQAAEDIAKQSPVEPKAAELDADMLLALQSADAESMADKLLDAAASLKRKKAAGLLKTALATAARHDDAPALDESVSLYVRIASSAMPEVVRKRTGTLSEAAQKQQLKASKIAVTSALLGALKELWPSATLPVSMLAAEATPWLALELLNPPVRVSLAEDGPALEEILRSLCTKQAWGSDFGAALKWLEALGALVPAGYCLSRAAYENLVSVYVDAVIAACSVGHSLKRHMHDHGEWLDKLEAVVGEGPVRTIKATMSRGVVERGREAPKLEVASDVPYLQLPSSVEVVWVSDADSCAAVEERLSRSSVVAIDTEWWNVGTGPALVQMAIGSSLETASCFLVDTLGPARQAATSMFHRLFAREDVTILGWSFDEDRRRLRELLSESDDKSHMDSELPVRDLQVPCTRLLEASSSPGLSLACFKLLGHPLDKTEQCSDWRRRPLTESQTRYAAMDAAVLLQLNAELLLRSEL